jgi:hypothetical protein
MESERSLERYEARLLEILQLGFPLALNTQNELLPRPLGLSTEAKRLWIGFYNHVEQRICAGGELEPVIGLANKLPEHAARLASVITLVDDIMATEVGPEEMTCGIDLAQHFASEALRLFGASQVNEKLREAQRLLGWLASRTEEIISLPEIYQLGPSSIREADAARKAANVLAEHGWLVSVVSGTSKNRREVWRIVRAQ